ncbi:MAG: hypothetical protein Q7O66_06790, partial [Dehalococcoidia bacterium]|nr:hypothetical protein [Dehalococcoidia bacterium]
MELQAGIGSNYIADTLIQPGRKAPDDPSAWHASDLRAKLLGSVRHDVAVLSGHFSSGSLLAADYATSMASAEISASTANLNNMLVYILGCHGGYTIPLEDELAGASPDPDWVKAFLRKGAAGLVASTGYAYGDTELVEYGERLLVNFAQQLRTGTGPVPIGKALVEAKKAYLA